MSEQSASPSLIRPFAIFTAISVAFYLWVVWDPIGTYGDVRGYLEYRVRVPVEWMAIFLALAWVIQIDHTTTDFAAVLLLPIFVLILTLSSPDSGAWFWSMFRQEICLPPVDVHRGLLLYSFLLCFVLLGRSWLKETKWAANGRGRIKTLLVYLVAAFLLTSWEAVFAESLIPRGVLGDMNMEEWRATAREGWEIVAQRIDQHVSAKWRDEVKIAASLYPFFALVLLLFPGYRKLPKEFLEFLKEGKEAFLFVGGLLGLSAWALWEVSEGNAAGGVRANPLLALLGIPAAIAAMVAILTSVLWVPLVLFLLPAFVFSVVSLPFKLAYFLVIYGPIMAWQRLHYMFVPHPAERVYREGLQNDIPLHIIAGNVADILYQQDFKAFRRKRHPPVWVSKNQEKRVLALCEELHAGNKFMEELKRNIRLRDELQL